MDFRYLCSRSELFRTLHLDGSKNPLIIGAPEDFIKWLDRILPTNTRIETSEKGGIDGGDTDLVLLWISKWTESMEEMLRAVVRRFSTGVPIFIAAPRNIQNRLEERGMNDIRISGLDPPFSLTLDLDLLIVSTQDRNEPQSNERSDV